MDGVQSRKRIQQRGWSRGGQQKKAFRSFEMHDSKRKTEVVNSVKGMVGALWVRRLRPQKPVGCGHESMQ